MAYYFVRHGESVSNATGMTAGQSDVALTKKGMAEAHMVGVDMKRQNISIDVLFSSPLKRAYNTAIAIASEIGYPVKGIKIDDRLMEMSFGLLEGRPIAIFDTLTNDERLVAGIESSEAMNERVYSFLVDLNEVEGNVLIVSHSGVGRRMLAKIQNQHLDEVPRLPNAELITLVEKNSGLFL